MDFYAVFELNSINNELISTEQSLLIIFFLELLYSLDYYIIKIVDYT